MINWEIKAKTELLKDLFEILALFIAALWAIYTFWFEKIIEPNNYPSFLTITSEIKKETEDSNFILYKIRMTLHNKSKVRESVIASWFEIDGIKLWIQTPALTDSTYNQYLNKNWDEYSRFPRYFSFDSKDFTVVHSGKILDEGIWLNPDQEITQEFVTLIPKNFFEVMILKLNAITGKKNTEIKVDWNSDIFGSTEPSLIPSNNRKDTIRLKSFLKKSEKFSKYFEDYDLSYTFNENEYSLGLLK